MPPSSSRSLDTSRHSAHDGFMAQKPPGRADLLGDLRGAGDNPLEVLEVVTRYRRLLDEVATRAATLARRTGRSWDDIAQALGTTRQAAWQRYRSVDTEERPSFLVMCRFPNRRRRHLAVRDAIVEDYGIRVSKREALKLTARLLEAQPAPDEVIVLNGRDPSSEQRISKKVSLYALSLYLTPSPAPTARDRRRFLAGLVHSKAS